MPENEKIDWTETDRVMQQLRAQLEAEHGETTLAEKQEGADPVPPVSTHIEEAEATPSPENEELSAPTAAVAVAVKEEMPESEAAEQEEATPATPTRQHRKSRKKRHRMPKLDAVNTATAEPLDRTVLEEKKQRAAALAREQESDLYWSRTSDKKHEQSTTLQTSGALSRTDENGDKEPLPKKPISTSEEEIEQVLVSHQKGALEGAAEKQDKPKEPMADITVEGLLNDIFGSTAGPGGRSWITQEEKSADSELTPQAKAAEGAGEANAADPTPVRAKKQGLPDDPTVEIGGYRVVLPDEKEGLLAQEAEPSQTTDQAAWGKLFSSFSVKRQREGALPKPSIAKLSAEQIEFKNELEESDEEFKFLVDLDYEDELGEAIGFEKILDYHERRINGKSRELHDKRAQRGDKHKFEYTSHAQDIGISKFYAKQRRRHLVNLIVTCLLLVLLFFYERSFTVLSLFGQAPSGARYPTLYVAVGLVIFLFGVWLLRRSLIGGFIRLLRLSPSDDSICSVVVMATLVYHVALLLAPTESKLSLYLSPAMGSLCLLALSGLFNWYREFCAFRVISSKQQKYALMSRVSVGNREGKAKLRLLEREQKERAWYVRPVGFVRNYFSNTEKKSDRQHAFGAALLLVMAISCALALYDFVVNGDLSLALHTAFVTFLMIAPIVSVLGTSLPMFCATCLRLGRRSAIIGECAVGESKKANVLVMSDSDCFLQMPHEQFELVKNCDAARATTLIRALLEKLGSPLCDTVDVPRESRISPDRVTLTDIDEFGVAAVVSDERKTPIVFGSISYLQKYGIRVSPKKDGRYEEFCRNMLCVAINNRLTALFIARYRLAGDMQTIAEMLEAENLHLKIRSKDPGIHSPLLAELFADLRKPPEVIKPLVAETDIAAERVDATVVALGSAREIARTLATCHRIHRAVKLGTLWQFASILFGALLGGVCVFFNLTHALPAFAVTLYTFLFSGAHALTSYVTLRDKEET